MSYSISAHTRTFTLATAVLLAFGLTGCGGGSSGSSSSTSGGSGSSSGSGSSGSGSSSSGACNYPDLITASERAQANSCGIQVSGAFGNADSYLNQAIEACQKGHKTEADDYYNNTYKKAVEYARSVARTLNCGGDNGPTLPNPSTQTYYNMCGKTTSTTRSTYCYGPMFKDQGGCGSGQDGFVYMAQYSSLNACTAAATTWRTSK